MGYYSKAHSTEKLASHSISQVLTQVTFPLYSEVQDDKRRMINILEQLIGIIAYMTFPLIAVLILIAKPLFILLYSDRWLDSVPYFQILCLAGLGICLQSVNLQTISAVGKSHIVFVWSVIKQTIGIILAVGGLLFFGINGLLWGAAIHSWSCLLINMYLVSRHIGYNLKSQLWSLFPVTAVTLVAFLASYLVGKELNLGLYISGGIKFIIFAIIYLGWTILFKPKPFCELRTLAFSKLKKKHGIISTEK
jgi:O-antigen/teichoic acid export membrane protein